MTIYIMYMNFYSLVHFANLFSSGILAGIEIGIHYGAAESTKAMGEREQIQFRQSMVLRLRVLIPVLFVLTAISSVAVTVIDGNSAGHLFRYAGLLTLGVWIATRSVGTVPINSASLKWNAAAPPSDWKTLLERAETFHIWGSWAAVALFAFFLAATDLK